MVAPQLLVTVTVAGMEKAPDHPDHVVPETFMRVIDATKPPDHDDVKV
jgi:hypothetical protein